MTKAETKTNKINKKESVEFNLSDGTKVVIKKGKGKDVLKARKSAPDTECVTAYLVSILGTFDGKKMPAEEILDLDMDDYALIEENFAELFPEKK